METNCFKINNSYKNNNIFLYKVQSLIYKNKIDIEFILVQKM